MDIDDGLLEIPTIPDNAIKYFLLPQRSGPADSFVDQTCASPLDSSDDEFQWEKFVIVTPGKRMVRFRKRLQDGVAVIRHDYIGVDDAPLLVFREHRVFDDGKHSVLR